MTNSAPVKTQTARRYSRGLFIAEVVYIQLSPELGFKTLLFSVHESHIEDNSDTQKTIMWFANVCLWFTPVASAHGQEKLNSDLYLTRL